MNQRVVIVGSALAIMILVIFGYYSNQKNQPRTLPTQETEGDTLKQTPLVITSSEPLAKILLVEQFVAAQNALVSHLKKTYPNAKEAAIDNPIVNQDGSISFNIKVTSYGKTLSAKIIRLTHGDIQILIPQDNYDSNVISVYAATGDSTNHNL